MNGLEPVVDVTTADGYRIAWHRHAPASRLVNENRGLGLARLADLRPGDRVPPGRGPDGGRAPDGGACPTPAADGGWSGEHHLQAPTRDRPLAELIGYFMGDGRSAVGAAVRAGAATTTSSITSEPVGQVLVRRPPRGRAQKGFDAPRSTSARLGRVVAGQRLRHPAVSPVPDADPRHQRPEVYAAFVRGLFEAEGSVVGGLAELDHHRAGLSEEVQTLLLALGYPTGR